MGATRRRNVVAAGGPLGTDACCGQLAAVKLLEQWTPVVGVMLLLVLGLAKAVVRGV
jgi:hypothetical protein